MESLQPFVIAGLKAHVDEVESGLTKRDEEVGVDRVGATIHLPDHAARKLGAMEFAHELCCPASPDGSVEREVVILEEEDCRSVLSMKRNHFFDDVSGLARTHDFPGSGAVERLDRAKRARARAPAAGQDRQNLLAEIRHWPKIPVGIWEPIEIVQEGAERITDDGGPLAIGQSPQILPRLAAAESID